MHVCYYYCQYCDFDGFDKMKFVNNLDFFLEVHTTQVWYLLYNVT